MVSVAQRSSSRASRSWRTSSRTATGGDGADSNWCVVAMIATVIIMPASAATPAILTVREEACSTGFASITHEAAEPLAALGLLGGVPRRFERLGAALRGNGGGEIGKLLRL